MTQIFVDYFKQHKDEIAALDFFYQQHYQRRALTLEMIEALREHLTKPLLLLIYRTHVECLCPRASGASERCNCNLSPLFSTKQWWSPGDVQDVLIFVL